MVVKKQKKDNVTHLNTYSLNKTLDNIRQYKRTKFVRFRTSAIILTGIVLIGLASLPLVKNLKATNEYTQVHAEAVTELENLENEREQLEYQVGLLEDEEYIAKLARQEFNVSKPNEILINLPEKEETEVDEEDSQEADAEK